MIKNLVRSNESLSLDGAVSIHHQNIQALGWKLSKVKFWNNKGNFLCQRRGLLSTWGLRKILRETNISYPLIRTRTCAYQGVRNVGFSENFANYK